jgi:hypothetical protein
VVEGTVSWASFAEAFDPAVSASFSNASNGSSVVFDATSLVSSWLDGSANHGMLLEANQSPLTTFHASEGNGASALRPALSVCYVIPED